MNKLVMLLDIYEEEVVWVHSVWDNITEKEATWIISKKFGFIKWLVDNDKIDFSWWWELSSNLVALFDRKKDDAEWLIALLSTSDTPIEDLVSYLK